MLFYTFYPPCQQCYFLTKNNVEQSLEKGDPFTIRWNIGEFMLFCTLSLAIKILGGKFVLTCEPGKNLPLPPSPSPDWFLVL